MGITSLTCMYPKEVSRAEAPPFIVLLCAQGAPLQEGESHTLADSREDDGGAIGHGLGPTPTPPKKKQLCRFICTLRGKVGGPPFPGLPSGGTRAGEETKLQFCFGAS